MCRWRCPGGRALTDLEGVQRKRSGPGPQLTDVKKKKKNREVMGVDMIAQHAGDARKEASQGSEELLH